MNFQPHDNTSDETSGNAAMAGDENVSLPLGLGENSDLNLGDLSGETPQKFNSSALLIVIVAVIAAVGLFSMRTLTRASASTDSPEHFEKSIDEFLVAAKADESAARGSVLDVLSESYSARQVPLDYVHRNPFIIFEEAEQKRPERTVDPLVTQRQARKSQFEAAATRLRVGMIVTGSQPMANINGKVSRVGDLVPVDADVSFRVVAITADRVDFIAEDEELEVFLETSVSLRRD